MSDGGGNSNIYQQASTNLMAGGNTLDAATAIGASGAMPAAAGMGAYANPFMDQVVGANTADIMRGAQHQLMNNAANATSAGAFGGSRHGVIDSMTNEAALRTVGNMSGDLRFGGFNAAAGLAGDDASRRISAGGLMNNIAGQRGNLGATQFGVGRQIGADQFAQGTAEQNLVQALLDDSSGMFNRYTNQPVDLLNFRNASLASSPLNNNTSTTSGYNPGLADYLSLGLQVGSI